jgi:TonB-dependent SusC/RagA subfamily outer membrane receptor
MKLLALVPIVGVALALNAETVNDYVYQQPHKKIVKKGNKSATAKIGNNTIEIIPDTVSNVRIDNSEVEWIGIAVKESDKKPMVLLEGHRITYETLKRMDSEEIASISVLKGQPAVDQYGEEARDGVVLITTKKGVKDISVPVEQTPEYFDVVEQMPEYPGGPSALLEYQFLQFRGCEKRLCHIQ